MQTEEQRQKELRERDAKEKALAEAEQKVKRERGPRVKTEGFLKNIVLSFTDIFLCSSF